MYIAETKEEMDELRNLCMDNDEKIAFLAKCIRKIISACDNEDSYKREQMERS